VEHFTLHQQNILYEHSSNLEKSPGTFSNSTEIATLIYEAYLDICKPVLTNVHTGWFSEWISGQCYKLRLCKELQLDWF